MRGAHPERAVECHVEALQIAPPGSPLVVACSGGPDSVALASLLARLAPRFEWSLRLAHVNHLVRESSWQDECVVLSVAARLGLPVHIAALERGRDDEQTLREKRYAALARIAREAAAATIVTAHTAEDQSETVLLALFRGTGLDGLAGMPLRRDLGDGITLVRPLLRIGRDAIRAELAASGLPYALDPANVDGRYRRSAVREALVALRREFPRLDEAVARCAAIVAGERDGTARAEARKALREVLGREAGLRDVSFERIEAALAAGAGGRTRRIHIKDGVELEVGDDGDGWHVRRHD